MITKIKICRGGFCDCIDGKHNARFLLCPGWLVMANTPSENVRAMTEAAVEYGQNE